MVWKPGTVLEAADVRAAIAKVNELAAGAEYPMLIDMANTQAVTRQAKSVFSIKCAASRIALLGSSPVDRVIANFDKSGVRQAGAYALGALANDWYRHGSDTGDLATGKAERQVCIGILCAYLRGAPEPRDVEVRKTIVGLIRSFTLLGERRRPSWVGHDFNLSGAQLKRAGLAHADLTGADLSEADLSMSVLVRADLAGANFTHASLKGALLTGANLSRADLSHADLSEAQLAEADLEGASWTPDTIWPKGYEPPQKRGHSAL